MTISCNTITTIKTFIETQLNFHSAKLLCTNIYLETHCKINTTYATHAYNNTAQERLLTKHQKESCSEVCHAPKCQKPEQFITG